MIDLIIISSWETFLEPKAEKFPTAKARRKEKEEEALKEPEEQNVDKLAEVIEEKWSLYDDIMQKEKNPNDRVWKTSAAEIQDMIEQSKASHSGLIPLAEQSAELKKDISGEKAAQMWLQDAKSETMDEPRQSVIVKSSVCKLI